MDTTQQSDSAMLSNNDKFEASSEPDFTLATTKGDCYVCGEYSSRLVLGVCPKYACVKKFVSSSSPEEASKQ